MRCRLSMLLLSLAMTIPQSLWAQVSDVELLPLGLETAWTAQARVPAYGQGIVSADLWVDEMATQRFAVAELPGGSLIRVSADKLDAKNQPIGMEKAKTEAQAVAAKLLGQSTGFEVAEVIIPSIRLVVVTANGLVQNFDAESGKLLWATPCGPLDTTALPAALSASGVLIVQGDSLYRLDWLTGKQLEVKHLPNSTSSGVTIIDGLIAPPAGVQRAPRLNAMAIVGDFSGNLIAYGLTEKISPWSSRTLGRSIARPAVSADRQTIAISTNSGMVYVFTGSSRPNVQFRYESGGGLTDSLAVGKDAFYVGGNDGSLAKISFAGQIVWSFHLSHQITSPALIDQENGLVFVCSESGELTGVDDATGYEAWDQPVHENIRGPVALSGSNVICRTNDDRLIALDRKTGQLKNRGKGNPTVNLSLLPAMSINYQTDRVYVAGKNGQLQCLRPIGRDLPKVFKPIEAAPQKPVETESATETAPASESGEASSPFGDPFGSGSTDTPAEPGDDPFGTSSDPFGGDKP